MASSLVLTFSDKAVDGNTFDFLGDGSTITFKPVRQNIAQVAVRTDASTQSEEFYKSFINDWNTLGQYNDVSLSGAVVTLVHNDNDHFNGFVDATHNLTPAITTSLTTTVQRPAVIEITVTYSEASTSPCDNVEANITFNQDVEQLFIQVYNQGESKTILLLDTSFNADSYDLDLPRDKQFVDIIPTVGDTTISEAFVVPSALLIDSVDVDASPYGALVTINANIPTGSSNTYAIGANGQETPYYPSNEFNGQLSGDKIAYVKDSYGCTRSFEFNIPVENVPIIQVVEDYFVSIKNSFKGSYRDMVENANIFNLLINEQPYPVPITNFYQVWGDHQTVRQQFKSSFPTQKVSAVFCNDGVSDGNTEITIPTTQITDNIERNTYLEGNVSYNSTYGRTAVSFVPGDRYNSSGTVTGTHSYNGVLPEFYEVGMDIIINNVAYKIQEKIEVSDIEYAILNQSNDITLSGQIIESIHMAQSYEVYNYDIVMADMPSEFRVQHKYTSRNGNTGNGYLTELQKVITKEELINGKYHICEFFNITDDSEINYPSTSGNTKQTRTSHFSNLVFTHPPTPISDSTIQSEKLDNKFKKLDYKSKIVLQLNLASMATEMAHKVAYQFNNSEYVMVDGMLCATFENAEVKSNFQIATVDVKIVVSEFVNGFNVKNIDLPSINPYYPVQTS